MEGRGNMQIFVDMAKTLAVFCLLEQVILNLLPSGIYERYVKFYLGLLLLILLLQPVLQIFLQLIIAPSRGTKKVWIRYCIVSRPQKCLVIPLTCNYNLTYN